MAEEERRRSVGRRAEDRLWQYRLEALEKLVEAIGPAVGQVARIDDAVESIEELVKDEREARRRYHEQALGMIREIREDMDDGISSAEEKVDRLDGRVTRLDEKVESRFASLAESRKAERRENFKYAVGGVVAIITALIGAAGAIIGTG
jgi:hypothetical protein